MRVFTQFFFATVFSFICSYCVAQWPQNGTLSGIGAGTVSILKTNWSTPTCTGTSKLLDATVAPDSHTPAPTSGSMNNDTWFSFQAKSTVIKVRVCNPTFDAAVEVWRIDNQTMVASFNANGDGGVEFGAATGLTYDGIYAVRVGRVSGSGAGTFILTIEHFTAQLGIAYTPSPPGSSCYTPINTIQRTNPTTTPANISNNTRWFFEPISPPGPTIGPCSSPTPLSLSSCYSFCLGQDYMAYCELRANDIGELGNIWWGTSEPKLMDFCESVCPTITSPTNNASLVNIRSTVFNVAALGAGSQVQWRFVTNNGATELCTPWLTTAGFTASLYPAFANCLEYNKFYQVYVRAKYCDTDLEPQWCGPITVFSQPMPRVNITPSECCKWRNKTGSIAAIYENFPLQQYRFRFTPVANAQNPCPQNNLPPIGPAITTGWSAASTISTFISSIQQGTTYNVQVQGRILSSNCTQCSGTAYTMPMRVVDWGAPCLVGFRAAGSPPVGTALSCGCNVIGMEEWNEEEYSALIAQFGTIEVDAEEVLPGDDPIPVLDSEESVLSIFSINAETLMMDLSSIQMQGNAEIRIHDVNGRFVASRMVFNTEDKSSVMLAINRGLSSGVYVVSIIGQDAVVTEKIFIQAE